MQRKMCNFASVLVWLKYLFQEHSNLMLTPHAEKNLQLCFSFGLAGVSFSRAQQFNALYFENHIYNGNIQVIKK